MRADLQPVFRSDQLVPLLYGYWARLEDLQNIQQEGKRIPGGISGRIENVDLTRELLERHMLALASTDPEAARELYQELKVSRVWVIARFAEKLKRELALSTAKE
jgi:hypothetical protein